MTEKTISELLKPVRAIKERKNSKATAETRSPPTPLARSLMGHPGKIPGPYNRKVKKDV